MPCINTYQHSAPANLQHLPSNIQEPHKHPVHELKQPCSKRIAPAKWRQHILPESIAFGSPERPLNGEANCDHQWISYNFMPYYAIEQLAFCQGQPTDIHCWPLCSEAFGRLLATQRSYFQLWKDLTELIPIPQHPVISGSPNSNPEQKAPLCKNLFANL